MGNLKPFHSLTDSELYKRCQEYGANARLWMRKFAALLPEVYRRKLYKKRGYVSIHEFAAKLAGMSESSVNRILHLSKKLSDKPRLKELFDSGSEGWGKLEKVASIATKETESEWAERVKNLSLHSLSAYVQELRNSQNDAKLFVDEHGENKTSIPQHDDRDFYRGSLPTDNFRTFSFSVGSEIEEKLRLFKQKVEKEKGQVLSWNETFAEMLGMIECIGGRKIIEKSKKVIQLCSDCIKRKADEASKNHEVTRYIPAEVKHVIEARSEGLCEFPRCHKPAEIYHHTRRYALKRNHDPNFIVALCKSHEGIAQSGLIENEEEPASKWRIRGEPDRMDLKILIDSNVQSYRRDLASLIAI